MLACYAGHLDVVKYLRRHGASWDTRDLGGCTALHWAADGGHCNVIERMIGTAVRYGTLLTTAHVELGTQMLSHRVQGKQDRMWMPLIS